MIILKPWAVYNEIEEYAADWLENLIALGVIAPGVVDRRSIIDVRPDDYRGFRQAHFFAGIGVWSYSLRRAGISDDTALWTGSPPCQPFSAAGAGGGVDDERHLWPALFHLIEQCRPRRFYGEQVASKDGLGWLDLVLTDMEKAGYAIAAVDTCSASSGAPHIRQRLRIHAYDLRLAAGWMACRDDHDGRPDFPIGREEGRTSDGWGRAALRLDDSLGAGLEGLGGGHRPATGQWEGSLRPVATAGGIEWVADNCGIRPGHGPGCEPTTGTPRVNQGGEAEWQRLRDEFISGNGSFSELVHPNGGHSGAEWEQRGREQRQQPQDGGGSDRTSPNRPGPTNGFWRDADWLFCRDGKWRPVVASDVEMVDGTAAHLGRSGPFSAEESETRLQAMLDTFGEEEIQRQAGRQWAFREESVLRPNLHGRLDGRADQEPDSTEQSEAICEDCWDDVRGMSGDRDCVPCASCRREPTEQRPLELEDVVRQLPQSLSLAELYGRRESARRLRLLQCAINEEGALLHPPVAGEAAWASIGEDAKDRIRLGFDVGAWRQVVSFPLVSGDDFKPGSGGAFEGKSRQGMLKGYGNAIDAEATIDFIEATLESDTIDIEPVGTDFDDLL